ncbi:hypothetical protein EUX98_g558 [Antrodiella citrinella]|uniref:RRM domain-containing protein n=1 Tax=Antrodiella citrinella TaxID=2447956 RepID=A0A4S4N5X0_9APHY|nr:hypothetical protein EUX98_g558 [Antrodiella citrinella]
MGSSSIYLGDIPANLKEEDVRRHLAVYGSIKSINLLPGYGFVEFFSEKVCHGVTAACKVPLVDVVLIAASFTGRDGGYMHLYKHDCLAEYLEQDVVDIFSRQDFMGITVKVELAKTKTRRKICVDSSNTTSSRKENRFLEYLSEEDANRAVKELNGLELNGSVVTLSSCVRKSHH